MQQSLEQVLQDSTIQKIKRGFENVIVGKKKKSSTIGDVAGDDTCNVQGDCCQLKKIIDTNVLIGRLGFSTLGTPLTNRNR